MITLNNILKEIKEVPTNGLEDIYQFIHSMISGTVKYNLKLGNKVRGRAG